MDSKKKFNELASGKDEFITCLVLSIEERTAVNGNLYQSIECRDAAGDVERIQNWNQPIQPSKIPAVFTFKVNTSMFQGRNTFKLLTAEEITDANMYDYIGAGYDTKKSRKAVVAYVEMIKDYALKRVVCRVINNQLDKFALPMGSKLFTRGAGIYEATLKLAKNAQSVARLYRLNEDLVVSSAIIYYVGHVKTVDVLGMEKEENYLLSPELITYEMVSDAINDLIREDEKMQEVLQSNNIKLLKHIIACSSKVVEPAIPEAIVLAHISNMICELERYDNRTKSVAPGNFVDMQKYSAPRFYVSGSDEIVTDSTDETPNQNPPSPVSGEEGANGKSTK